MTTISPRRVSFDWTDTPLHWIPEDPQSTHTINVLHLLLPEGEKWFVSVYREALPLITDDLLRQQVKGFMGQESIHARSHAVVLDHLASQGIDSTPFTDEVDWLFNRALADQPLGLKLSGWMARGWLKQRLAIIAAVEHYTSVLGMWALDSPGLDEASADPTMLDLIRWHSAEEVEHRNVAFDLFEHISGSYLRRALAMIVTSIAMIVLWIRGTRFFVKADPTHPHEASWSAMLEAQRQGRLPTFRAILGTVPHYFAPSFHPSRFGDTDAALRYLASSPAALAAAAATG